MSGRGFGWAKRQNAPCRDTKALLVFLADYVQDTPFAWPSVSTMARELQVSERSVQRMLPLLLEAGLIIGYEVKDKATGRCRTRAYFFPIDADLPTLAQVRAFELNAGCILTPLDPGHAHGEGDNTVTPEGDGAVTGEGDNTVTGGVTTVSPLKEHLSEQLSDADASSAGARASEVDLFDEAWGEYPEAGRLGASSERLGRKAWADELVGGAEPGRMVAGIRAYAARPSVWGASGRPKAFHRFLTDGCWVEFADAPTAPASSACKEGSAWGGPADLRAQLVKAKGEDWVRCYLEPSSWNGSAVVARTNFGAGKLREAVGRLGLELLVLNPP